jgi:dihydroorotate dehydrogenase electron transfer subunit
VHAFVGGRTAADLLGVEVLEALSVPVTVATEDGSRGHAGLVTAPLSKHLEAAGDRVGAIYSCGPTPMMEAVERLAVARGLPHQVSLEAPMACGIGVCLSCIVPERVGGGGSGAGGREEPDGEPVGGPPWRYRRVCRDGPVFDARGLAWDRLPPLAEGRRE